MLACAGGGVPLTVGRWRWAREAFLLPTLDDVLTSIFVAARARRELALATTDGAGFLMLACAVEVCP